MSEKSPDTAAQAPASATENPPVEESAKKDVPVVDAETLKQSVVDVLKTVYDPEIPVNIYDLGMIYEVIVGTEQDVEVKMTLTSPACPVAGTLPGEVQVKVGSVEGVSAAKVDLVWEPPWTPARMSMRAKLELNMV